jgi:hypothetical protein
MDMIFRPRPSSLSAVFMIIPFAPTRNLSSIARDCPKQNPRYSEAANAEPSGLAGDCPEAGLQKLHAVSFRTVRRGDARVLENARRIGHLAKMAQV